VRARTPCPARRLGGSMDPQCPSSPGADGASRSTCGCPAPDRLVVVRRVAVNRSAQREDALQQHVHMPLDDGWSGLGFIYAAAGWGSSAE
jgi:hypothetical protein